MLTTFSGFFCGFLIFGGENFHSFGPIPLLSHFFVSVFRAIFTVGQFAPFSYGLVVFTKVVQNGRHIMATRCFHINFCVKVIAFEVKMLQCISSFSFPSLGSRVPIMALHNKAQDVQMLDSIPAKVETKSFFTGAIGTPSCLH